MINSEIVQKSLNNNYASTEKKLDENAKAMEAYELKLIDYENQISQLEV